MGALSPREKGVARAVAEAMFPGCARLPVDAAAADVVGRLDRYVGFLPPPQARHVRALLAGLVVGYGLYRRAPTAFVDAALEDRRAYLVWLGEHPNTLARKPFEALRAIFTMLYVDSPAVRGALGIAADAPGTRLGPEAQHG